MKSRSIISSLLAELTEGPVFTLPWFAQPYCLIQFTHKRHITLQASQVTGNAVEKKFKINASLALNGH
jgi:hypothetical protein